MNADILIPHQPPLLTHPDLVKKAITKERVVRDSAAFFAGPSHYAMPARVSLAKLSGESFAPENLHARYGFDAVFTRCLTTAMLLAVLTLTLMALASPVHAESRLKDIASF